MGARVIWDKFPWELYWTQMITPPTIDAGFKIICCTCAIKTLWSTYPRLFKQIKTDKTQAQHVTGSWEVGTATIHNTNTSKARAKAGINITPQGRHS